MNEDQVRALLLHISAGMQYLSIRVFLILVVCMTFGLFSWAMYMPGPYRLGTAVAFAVLVFLPTLSLEKKEKQHEHQAP